MKSLDEIALLCGTDKSSDHHNYCVKYEKYLPFERDDKLNILEIGVQKGQSLRMWKEYYSNSTVVGVDIDVSCTKFNDHRINIEIGNQIDVAFLKNVIEKYQYFDLVIDDGSHINSDVIFSFEHLFPAIKTHGIYIVEDTCTSYWSIFGGGMNKSGSSVEYFKNIIDQINFLGEYNEISSPMNRKDVDLLEQFRRKGYNYIGMGIESLNFINSAILITKR